MRIQWGLFLTLLLSVVVAASDLWGQMITDGKTDQTNRAGDQIPLAANSSLGWMPTAAGMAVPPTGMAYGGGFPVAQPPGPWPTAPIPSVPGGYPVPMHGGPYAAVNFEDTTTAPQPFPMPADPGLEQGGEMYSEEPVAPYPGPFDGWLGGSADCAVCGGAGCPHCIGTSGGLLGWIANGMQPYTEGGFCAPRWYDITLDGMYLSREDVSRTIAFASDGVNGNIVLSTNDLAFQEELGFRFTGATQVTAGLIAEFTYFGLFNWADGAAVTRSDFGDFYSVYSDFGTNPLTGFDQTDRSTLQRITYSSTLDNFELNFRRRWSAANCEFQGSWLAGVRYLYLLEDFEYDTTGGDDLGTAPIEVTGRQFTDVRTRNSLTGFQIGADLWTTVTPGISLGGELKLGVLGNYANRRSSVLAETIAPPALPAGTTMIEEANINDIAMVGEGRFEMIYRTGPNWTIRGGYTFLFLDGVALAVENFDRRVPPNVSAPPPPTPPRPVFKNDNGNVFYHGGHFGVEYMW